MVLVKHLKNNVIKNFILLLSFTPNTDYNEGGGGAEGGHDQGAQSTYFPRDETGSVCQPTQLERTLQLWGGPGGGGVFRGHGVQYIQNSTCT
jgi:hypothetical protein